MTGMLEMLKSTLCSTVDLLYNLRQVMPSQDSSERREKHLSKVNFAYLTLSGGWGWSMFPRFLSAFHFHGVKLLPCVFIFTLPRSLSVSANLAYLLLVQCLKCRLLGHTVHISSSLIQFTYFLQITYSWHTERLTSSFCVSVFLFVCF